MGSSRKKKWKPASWYADPQSRVEFHPADYTITAEDIAHVIAGHAWFFTGNVYGRQRYICDHFAREEAMWILAMDADTEDPLITELVIPEQEVSACSCECSIAAQHRCIAELQARNKNAVLVGHTHQAMQSFVSTIDHAACITQLDAGLALRGAQRVQFRTGDPRADGALAAVTAFPVPGLGPRTEILVRGGKRSCQETRLVASRPVEVTSFYTTNARHELCAVNRVRETCFACGHSNDRTVPADEVVFHVVGSYELGEDVKEALDEEIRANVRWTLSWSSTWKNTGRPVLAAPVLPTGDATVLPKPARPPVPTGLYDIFDGDEYAGTIDSTLLAKAVDCVPEIRDCLTDRFCKSLNEQDPEAS